MFITQHYPLNWCNMHFSYIVEVSIYTWLTLQIILNPLNTDAQMHSKRIRKKSIVWEHFTIETIDVECKKPVACNVKLYSPIIHVQSYLHSHLKHHIALGIFSLGRTNQQDGQLLLKRDAIWYDLWPYLGMSLTYWLSLMVRPVKFLFKSIPHRIMEYVLYPCNSKFFSTLLLFY